MQFVLGQSPDMTKFGRGSQLAKSLAVSWYMFLKTLTGEPKSPTASPSVPHPIPMRCKRKGTDRIQTLSAGLKWCSSLEPMQGEGVLTAPKRFQPGCWCYCFLKDTCARCQHLVGACLGIYLCLWSFLAKNDVCYAQMTLYLHTWKAYKQTFLTWLKMFQWKFSSGLQTHYLENTETQLVRRGL